MARVLLFGALRDLAGWRELDLEGFNDLTGLKSELGRLYPDLAEALVGPGVQVAVDKALVRGNIVLSAMTEVAFLPPMSGG
jgi:molybdopterin synthase sulfur carrier subunit